MSSSRVPAEKSVLLNYEDQSKWTVWIQALRNKHTTALITNTICLLAIAVSPLFSSYIYLQQPSNGFTRPLSNISVLQELGLQANPSFEITDAAAGFMKASSKYEVDSPPYIRFLPAASWTSVEVSVPILHEAGIIKTQTVCVKSLVSCTAISNLAYDTQSTTIKGSTSTCSFSTDASQSLGWSASIPFGVTPASCSSSINTTENAAVAFWVLGEAISGGGFGSSAAVAAVCTPTIQVQRADGFFNSSTNSLLLVNGQTPLTDSDKTSVNLNAAPFNGSAYNGLFFDNVTTVADEIALNSTVFGLGQAIASLFQKNDTTLTSSSAFEAVVSDAYAHYLGLIVPALYYKNLDGVLTNGVIHPTDQRLFISTPVTHVLFVLLILIALGGLAVVVLHRRAARQLILTSEPGTLAAAIALAGHSDMSQMLKGYDTEEEMRAMLADLRFTIDPATHQLIVEEDEMGYGELPKRFVPRTPMDPMSPSTWVPTTYEDKA